MKASCSFNNNKNNDTINERVKFTVLVGWILIVYRFHNDVLGKIKTQTHTDTQTQTRIHRLTYTNTHRHTHTDTHTQTQTQTHTHTHARARARAYTHTNLLKEINSPIHFQRNILYTLRSDLSSSSSSHATEK